MRCRECGREVKEAWSKCPSCGHALSVYVLPMPHPVTPRHAPPIARPVAMPARPAPTARKISRMPRNTEEEQDLRNFLEERAARLFVGQSNKAYGSAGAVCSNKVFDEYRLSAESIIFPYDDLRQSVVVNLAAVIGYWPSAVGVHEAVLSRLNLPEQSNIWSYKVYVVPASYFDMEKAELPRPTEPPLGAVARAVSPRNARPIGDERRDRRVEELIAA